MPLQLCSGFGYIAFTVSKLSNKLFVHFNQRSLGL